MKRKLSQQQQAWLAVHQERKKVRDNTVTIPYYKQAALQRVSKGPEKKNTDTSIAIGLNNLTWNTPSLLNSIAEGPATNQRIGRKIVMTKLDIFYSWGLVSGTTGGGSARIKVVYDRQSNGGAPAITNVFAIDDFKSLNNLGSGDRFVTLVDHITEPVSVGGEYTVSGKISKKIRLETVYSGTGATIASITTGAIYIFYSSKGIGGTAAQLDYYTRIRYIDN